MKLPRRVLIGWQNYLITELVDDDPEVFVYGDILFDEELIRVRTEDMSPANIANTLIHEILHGIWHASELPKIEAEEQVVTHLANGLTQVLRDNPSLIRWLMKRASE